DACSRPDVGGWEFAGREPCCALAADREKTWSRADYHQSRIDSAGWDRRCSGLVRSGADAGGAGRAGVGAVMSRRDECRTRSHCAFNPFPGPVNVCSTESGDHFRNQPYSLLLIPARPGTGGGIGGRCVVSVVVLTKHGFRSLLLSGGNQQVEG